MKKLGKLRLTKFTYQLKVNEMKNVFGGGKTNTYGHTTTKTSQDEDSSSGDWDNAVSAFECKI